MTYTLPIDPMLLIIGFSVLSLALLVVVIVCIVKLNKLYRRYDIFMRGRDAESLEDTMMEILDQLKDLNGKDRANKDMMKLLTKQVHDSFQKFGVVKYNAFRGMGGNLSFAIAMLNDDNSGFVLDVVHSREGCYLYLKEVEQGTTEVLLGNEEQEALEQALGYVKRTPLAERLAKAERAFAGRKTAGSSEQAVETPSAERLKSERMKELRKKKLEEETAGDVGQETYNDFDDPDDLPPLSEFETGSFSDDGSSDRYVEY